MTVYVIFYNDMDSWNSMPVFRAVATNKAAAKRWIQDEVDGKHESLYLYAKDRPADWWIEYGTFQIRAIELVY